ncbi:MAG: T9SS type A sorting domain-containing protein [bacterium]|nr:T9SS type A sorting domain-containing protein [bacterium]
MIRRYALWGSGAKLGVALLLVALTTFATQVSKAQADKPELPTLSLTGHASQWNQTYYPDGRIWVPRRGTNGERTLLVPVFIKNCWRSTSTYEAFPIYSFKTKIQFDSTALEFMGVEKNGPVRGQQGLPLGALAKDFEFSSSVSRDTTFQRVIAGPLQNRLRGKRVMITAVSSKQLPQTGNITETCDQRPFVELFYLRFRVIANPASNPVSARTPLILTNDTLFYNDFQVGYELPFPGDPVPGTFAGLGGVDNYFFDQFNQEQIRDPLRPSRPGMIWVEVTDEIPRLSFTNVSDRRFRIADSVDNSNNADWFVVDPITIDSGGYRMGQPFEDEVNGAATRDIDVINATAGSRMTDILVQSDSKWLFFKSFRRGGLGEIDPFLQPVREGIIPILDKGILGTTLGVTPAGDPTTLQRDLNLRIICDWTKLDTENPDGEFAGVYVGYLTFKSLSMDVSPVRLKVTFIVFRPPFEPSEFDEKNDWQKGPSGPTSGIVLEVRNSNNPIERTLMVFGVGARATDYVDTLFGETVYTGPLTSFGARFHPRDSDGNDIYAYGLGDLFRTTYDASGANPGPRSNSRDIRDIYSDSTLQYWVKFNAGSALNYPIVVSWDAAQFPAGASLFIRDTLNGSRFNLNMREGTSLGGTRFSITIRDADITAFVIEYTLPRVMQFPVINLGWNLLSIPVNPSSGRSSDVFPNALNIPVRFSQNIYQAEATVRPGVGYFVKYSDPLDRTVAGTRIYRIDETRFQTRLYDGWNTIGSLSVPVSIVNVTVAPVVGVSTGLPMIIGDIYKYETNRGYVPVTEITPGLGYWMKISGQAWLVMDDPTRSPKTTVGAVTGLSSVIGSTTLVNVRDNDNKSANLYLDEQRVLTSFDVFGLPPLPPNNLFDVRFSNQAYVENSATPVIDLQGATFPVSVIVNNPSRNYTAVNAVTGEVLGSIKAGSTSTVQVINPRTPSVRLLGDDADLSTLSVNVTPNPVATSGVVAVTVPQAGNVTVSLFNTVGEEVAVLFSGHKTTGVFNFDMNSSNIAPGRYILKVVNGATVATASVTIVR